MKRYARVVDGVVQEIIEPFERTEDMRPPLPEPLGEDATAEDMELYVQALRHHDDFQLGEVPIEERFTPELVATLVEVPGGASVAERDTYDGKKFGPPAPPPEMTEQQALSQRDTLLAYAATRIAPLQDAVDLDEASDEEVAALKAWKQYRVKLGRVNTLPGFPGSFTWPEAPQ